MDYNHVFCFDEDLGQVISNQYYRYIMAFHKNRMEPYIRKAIQNAVRIHAPNYVHIKTGGQSLGTDGIREFWISWYGLPIVKKYVFIQTNIVDYEKLI